MMYRVVFAPEAEEQLAELFRYIATAASPGIAERYVNAVISYCERLDSFPLRGAKRDLVIGQETRPTPPRPPSRPMQ